jgi:hypothetical protein
MLVESARRSPIATIIGLFKIRSVIHLLFALSVDQIELIVLYVAAN